MSAELVAHKPHCSNRNLLQLFALVLCAPLPTRRKLRFHLCNSCISSLVFVVREPCVRSTRMRGILLRSATQAKWHNERIVPIYVSAVRSGATEERLLRSQSRLVSPANDDYSCREFPLTEWWEKYRRGPERGGASIFGY